VETPALIEMDMFNELDGWAVSEAEIVRTNDGAITWYDVTPPDMDETGFGVDTYFLDVDHAWIQKPDFDRFPNSGFMYHTTDGGLSWTTYTVPFSRGDLNFIDPMNGWALADLGVGAGSNAVAVYRTSDGGENWNKMYTNDPNQAEAGDSLPLGGIKTGLAPLDMETAWVTGVIYAPGEVYLYRTDGGNTWSPVTLELPPSAEEFELAVNDDQMKFVSQTHGYLVLHRSGNTFQSLIYVTRDAGNTWTLTPTIIDGVGSSVFLSEEEAVLYNGEQFYLTRDGAQSWETVSPDVAFGETFLSMEFVNLRSGWVITMDPATNERSLYRTHDGGATWLPVFP
jgi:photosystem II stability/assembly factor-like uncharacterized protein